MYFNWRHRSSGHLFQGRYKSFLVQEGDYLLGLSRYVHLNPVRGVSLGRGTPAERRKRLRAFRWSSCCRLDGQRDRTGNFSWFNYDTVNRLVLSFDTQNRMTEYVYDPAANLTQLIDPNWNSTWWVYDSRNRVSKKIYNDGSSYLYDYDGVGNLLHQTDAKAVVTTYGYDVVNNLTSIAAPGLATIGFTYDSLNRRTQMTDGTGTTMLGYDLASQLTTIDGPLANDLINLSYDALGRMLDAYALSTLLRGNLVARAHVPRRETRMRKNLLRQRLYWALGTAAHHAGNWNWELGSVLTFDTNGNLTSDGTRGS